MMILFPADPLAPRSPDSAYEDEVRAAESLGIAHGIVNFEALVDENDAHRAVRSVAGRAGEPEWAVYRGWMLRPERYAALYDALAARGVRLLNDPAAYRHAHYLPENYAVMREHTPRTVWTSTGATMDEDAIAALLQPFGDSPVVLKDWVKSRKHEWAEACFIPRASDRDSVLRVVRRFVALQGSDLAEGLVFREYVPLAPLGRETHPQSAMPLAAEFRAFFLDGEPISVAPYWDAAHYPADLAVPVARFVDVARRVQSRFFTLDLARRKDSDDWLVIELGDAQVAGLPGATDPAAFYQSLRARLSG